MNKKIFFSTIFFSYHFFSHSMDAIRSLTHSMAPEIIIQMMAGGASPQDICLMKAMTSENETVAFVLYSQLAESESHAPWNMQALLQKGTALYHGKGIVKDREKALNCYRECFKKYKDPKSLLMIGEYYEDAVIDNHFQLAAGHYKKAADMGEPMGAFRYARLIYNDKITSENALEEALHYLRLSIYNTSSDLMLTQMNDALFMYATTLLDNDRDEEFMKLGLPCLRKAASQGDASSMHQLGILYRHGLYVDKDIAKGEDYFNKALHSEDTQANLVTKMYMFMRGDGVAMDKKKAIELLAQAANGPSDIRDLYMHFADDIAQVEKQDTIEQQAKAIAQLPVADEIKTETTQQSPAATLQKVTSVQDKKNIKKIWKKKEQVSAGVSATQSEPVAAQTKIKQELIQPASVTSTSKIATKKRFANVLDMLRVKRESLPKTFPYQTIIEKCNKLSLSQDGSYIEIDPKKMLILIHDPRFKKLFGFEYDEGEFHHDIEPRAFKYHDRVIEALEKNVENSEVHKFGRAADYVMQLFGVLNPYQNKKNDMLAHPAISLKQKLKGQFELTFFKTKRDYILYHRMFKPLKKPEAAKTIK